MFVAVVCLGGSLAQQFLPIVEANVNANLTTPAGEAHRLQKQSMLLRSNGTLLQFQNEIVQKEQELRRKYNFPVLDLSPASAAMNLSMRSY